MCLGKIVQIPDPASDSNTMTFQKSFSDRSDDHKYSPEGSVSSDMGELRTHQPYASQTHSPVPAALEEKARRRPIKPWALIPTDSIAQCNMMASFPPGWTFNVYDGRLMHYFEIPSQQVAPTHGAIRYIEHYNETGPYSRFRFQVCHNFACGKCTKGMSCTYIHALALPQSHLVHVNGSSYPTLPTGVSLFVHTPGSSAAPQLIPSEMILRTAGSERLFEDVLNGYGSAIQRPQHCAHFQFKKVCNRGCECMFVHSMVPAKQ